MADAFDEGRVLSQLPAMELVRIEQTDRWANLLGDDPDRLRQVGVVGYQDSHLESPTIGVPQQVGSEVHIGALLNARNLRTVPLSPAIAAETARIRAAYQLKTPDAVQLATAKEAGATAFLTNDAALAAIPELRLIVLDHLRRESRV